MNLSARGVGVSVRGKPLLADVSLSVLLGEVLAVVGPNGAGKSTLLRTLCGDLRPTAGEVSLNGRPLSDWSPKELATRRAVLLQSSALTFGFTALEVVMLGRGLGEADEDLAWRALAAVGLEEFHDRLYPTLSGGEQQRIQLARVLAQLDVERGPGPKYLFLDEPTASLDLAHQHDTLRVARQTAASGAGVFVVLHDLNLATQYADRVAVLSKGRIVAMGQPADTLRVELIEAVFGVRVWTLPVGTPPRQVIVVGDR